MRIVSIAPLAVGVELSLTDCIALYDACQRRAERLEMHGGRCALPGLGAALLAAALAAHPHDEGEVTIAALWRTWAPLVALGGAERFEPLPVPPEYAD